MTPKENVEELISKFMGYVYPYCGSDFMTGTESEDTKRYYSIKCALIVVREIIASKHIDNSLKFLLEVEHELKNMQNE